MYIELGKEQHPCTGMPALTGDTLRFYLPEGGPELTGVPVGSVRLCRDDGFQLCEVPVDGYLRWGMDGNTLVITKEPEPVPTPEPEPVPPITEITTDQLAQTVVDMMFDIDQMKLNGGIVK